jgi:hypothetical protein
VKTNFKKWPMESLSTRMPRGPMRQEISEDLISRYSLTPDGFGLMLETPLLVVPVSSLPEAEREAMILAHQERIERELARLDMIEHGQRRGPSKFAPKDGKYSHTPTPRLPYGVKRDDLKLVSCARCSLPLLGESQESIRAAHANARHVENFPPPVAARLHGGRPYCATCAAVYDGDE